MHRESRMQREVSARTRWNLRPSRSLAGALLLGLLIACGGGEEAARQEREAARAAEWEELEATQAALEEHRRRLAQLREQAAAEEEDGAPEEQGEAAEGAPTAAAEAERLEEQIAEESQAFYDRVVAFINSAEITVGEEMPERVKAAIRMKSHEDIQVAREYIDQGGDYVRAIEIYQTALSVDPDNEELKSALAWAEEHRWMSEERFGQAKKGMTREEVKALLGQPNLHNIRDYPERNAVAWFYPKGADRSAAGIFFQKRGDGPYKVYLLDFDAVKPAGGEREGA